MRTTATVARVQHKLLHHYISSLKIITMSCNTRKSFHSSNHNSIMIMKPRTWSGRIKIQLHVNYQYIHSFIPIHRHRRIGGSPLESIVMTYNSTHLKHFSSNSIMFGHFGILFRWTSNIESPLFSSRDFHFGFFVNRFLFAEERSWKNSNLKSVENWKFWQVVRCFVRLLPTVRCAFKYWTCKLRFTNLNIYFVLTRAVSLTHFL